MRKEGKKNKGQILIESLVAISIGIVALTAFLTYLSQTLASTRIMNERAIAVYLAIEGLEVVKNILDADYVEGEPWGRGFEPIQNPPLRFEVQYNTNMLDSPPDSVSPAFSTKYFFIDPVTGVYSYNNSGIETPYRRTIVVRWNVSGAPGNIEENMKVESRVRWTEKRTGTEQEVAIESYFFDWRVEPED